MQLLEHFKELTIHPKNAQELKGLILQLAIQGKLTQKWREENPNIQSEEYLLHLIQKGKETVLEESGVKKEKPIDKIKEEDKKFKLPSGWVWSRFASTAYIVRGGSPRPIKSYLTEDPNGLNWIKIGDTKGATKYIETCAEKIIPEGLKKSRYVKEGDFILSNSMSFGKPFIMKTDGCIHDGWLLIREVKEAICKDYLYYLLLSPYTYGSFKDSAAGGVVQNLNIEKVRQTLLPIPPLEEQRAIVSIVNQLFTEVNQLETQTKQHVKLKEDFVTSALKRLTENSVQTHGHASQSWGFLKPHFKTFFNTKDAVKKLRETILQLAVQGKLTHHWRLSHPLGGDAEGRGGIEPASVLLEKIKAEKEMLIKEKKIKKEKSLPAIEADEIPYELPDGWVWCRLGQVSKFISSGSRDWAKYYSPKGAKFVTMGNLSRNSFKMRLDKMRYVMPPKSGEGTRTKLQQWDYLMSITGDVGNLGLIPKDFGEAYINQHTAVVRMMKELRNHYVGYYFLSPLAKEQFNEPQRGIKNSFRLSDIQYLLFPLPPLEEQEAIVAKVNSLMALCDQLEQEIEQNTKQVEDLMQSCLKEVFEN